MPIAIKHLIPSLFNYGLCLLNNLLNFFNRTFFLIYFLLPLKFTIRIFISVLFLLVSLLFALLYLDALILKIYDHIWGFFIFFIYISAFLL